MMLFNRTSSLKRTATYFSILHFSYVNSVIWQIVFGNTFFSTWDANLIHSAHPHFNYYNQSKGKVLKIKTDRHIAIKYIEMLMD